jgi:2-amino-4-hydroxy-6-hydroxymethyldihydropteridine diphosphokinase
MHKGYLLLGTNLGNRLTYLQNASEFIQSLCGKVIRQSSIYETAAWGLTDQPAFYNQVLVIETILLPEILMQTLLSIEEKMGRKRTIKFGPRTIDIDILLIDDITNNSPLLTLPHPALPQRRFALMPLAEVAATIIHPVEKKSIAQLLLACTDTLNVQKITTST